MQRDRAKNINDDDIAGIVAMLDGWSGKLSWELLIDAIELRKHSRYTRQALHKHARIKDAFALRKKALSENPSAVVEFEFPELAAAQQRIARLDAEVTRLEAENNRLMEQFVRWAYNAHTRGLGQAFLNIPLPSVNRDQSDRKSFSSSRQARKQEK